MSNPAIKPCPFCGKIPEEVSTNGKVYWIACVNEDCPIQLETKCGRVHDEETAIVFWNTRKAGGALDIKEWDILAEGMTGEFPKSYLLRINSSKNEKKEIRFTYLQALRVGTALVKCELYNTEIKNPLGV